MKKLPGMTPFWERFPDVAARETRGVIVSPPQNPQPGDLPSDTYVFGEFYCDDPACDCRRVLFHVWSHDRPNIVLATINYGWESEAFYTQWMHGDREAAREIRDASLDPLNPQSEWSPLLLNLFQKIVLADPAYIARLARRYEMFKDGSRKCPTEKRKL